ncbi:hypothetical protein DNTS_024376 [Danionella cerebrum]|uniref:Telomeric repeat-binding factor 2-interacting protein 1 n=1 Tax=Danionella cerebrum TaxID=2873325 RepID=A0A553QXR6_9TELE|nr:hypothetical protein DNTS_024376 [Danionella translucida]TRY94558.1 hypothetical protein DNTS_024376 [Danionella translucida]
MSRKMASAPLLFKDSSGQPMRFYLRPGPTKTELFPLITNGGGVMCRNQEPGAILLIDPSDACNTTVNSGQKYFSTKYIKDCAEKNVQLDLDDYVITIRSSVQTRMASCHQANGRLSYSLEDDEAIMRFIEDRQNEVKGNRVWIEMQKKKVTVHSWQSMKDRFLKHLHNKLRERSQSKSSVKRKPLDFKTSPVRKKKISKVQHSLRSPQQAEPDSCDVWFDAPSSPERASSPPEHEHPGSSKSDCEPPGKSNRSTNKTHVQRDEREIAELDVPKSSRVDPGGQDIVQDSGSNAQLSVNKPRQKNMDTSSNMHRILAKAAREFEDGSVESEEGENSFLAPIVDSHESSASAARLADEPERDPEPSVVNQSPAHEEVQAGPSSRFQPSELIEQCSHVRETPEEILHLLDAKNHVISLMRDTNRDLVEVMKALLKSSGDLRKAQDYLQSGEVDGAFWTIQDDQKLLQADEVEIKHLHMKFGEQGVRRRRAFLTDDAGN